MLASMVHIVWFLRHLLKSLPIVLGFQLELFLLGVVVWSWLRRLMPGKFTLPEVGLVGLGVTIFFAETWSLFGGLYPWANGVLCSITLLCLVFRRRAAAELVRDAWNQTSLPGLLVLLPIFFVAAWNALTSSIACYDIESYHLQAVRWATEFGSVPGLANLHGRLGFNSALHVFAALLSSPGGSWLGREYANSLIVTTTLAILVQGVASHPARSTYALLLLPLPTSLLFSDCLSGPQPDVAAASAAILFCWYLQDIAFERESLNNSAFFLALLTGTMAVLFKLSYVGWEAVGTLVAVACWIRSGQRMRQLLVPIVLVVVFCAPWIFRGYLTSGYPLFPAEIGRIEFDWTVPHKLITDERAWVLSWARAPFNSQVQQVLSGWSWLGPWIQQLPSEPIIVKASIMALAGLLTSIWLLRPGFPRAELSRWIALFLPALGAVLFWFFSAPSPRFAQATIWILAVDLFYLGMVGAKNMSRAARTLAAIVSVAFLVSELIPGLARLNGEKIRFPNYIGVTPPVVLQYTTLGTAIWVPQHGKYSGDWNLPVTPPDRFQRKLEQRGSTLRDGFRIRDSLGKR
jgi:hypothetical protein